MKPIECKFHVKHWFDSSLEIDHPTFSLTSKKDIGSLDYTLKVFIKENKKLPTSSALKGFG